MFLLITFVRIDQAEVTRSKNSYAFAYLTRRYTCLTIYFNKTKTYEYDSKIAK